jgi:hypothetical protein
LRASAGHDGDVMETAMTDEFGFVFQGKQVTAQKFKPVYISEFRRVLETYAPAGVRSILEWGSGLTTQMLAEHASRLTDFELLLTIDSNAPYQEAIFAARERPAFLKEVALDLVGPQSLAPELAYSTYPLGLGGKFDLIFIDGRRRMECAFIAALVCHEKTVIVVHDYRRLRYQPILALFDLIEDGKEFRVLRPRLSVMAALGRVVWG